MKEFQFFHLCDHSFKITNEGGVVREIEIENNRKSNRDLIINGAVVLSIIEVRVLEFEPVTNIEEFLYDNNKKEQTYEDKDPEDGYYDNGDGWIVDYSKYFEPGSSVSKPLPAEFYEAYLHNRIKWNVKPPIKYVVKVKIMYSNNRKKVYSLDECPSCQGKGWYVDLLDNNGKFSYATGIERVIQRVIKDLFTKLRSNRLDLTYGTTIHSMINQAVTDDEKRFDNIRLIVSDVEDQYLTRQSEYINELDGSEILTSLMVQNVFRSSKKTTSVVLELMVRTQSDSRVFRISV